MDPSLSVCRVGAMKRECCQMVKFLGAVCWCRESIYIPTKCTLFQIMHQNKAQNTIQCHYNNIWKQICIENVSYITHTYLRSNEQRKETCQKYIWALYHELVLFLQSRNYFCYVTENYTKGGISVWTPSNSYVFWYRWICFDFKTAIKLWLYSKMAWEYEYQRWMIFTSLAP